MYDRIKEWRKFDEQVEKHIEQYTKVQYGDAAGEEQIEQMTVEGIKVKLDYYIKRMGKGARGPKEELRDMLKIAHFAQFAYDKIRAATGEPDVYGEVSNA